MSAEGESSSNHAVVPTNALETASTVDMDTNKHILNSLNNIDQNNGFAKIAGQVAGKGRKGRPILRPTVMSPSQNMNITLAAQILKEHEKILNRTMI